MTILDKIDKQILQILLEDARISNQELAERVNLSPSPCWRRVKRLEDERIINKYVTLLDSNKLGLSLLAYTSISLGKHQTKTIEEFESAIQKSPEVTEFCTMTGKHDYLLRIAVKNMGHYEAFLKSVILPAKGVQSIHTSFVLNQKKYSTALPLENV